MGHFEISDTSWHVRVHLKGHFEWDELDSSWVVMVMFIYHHNNTGKMFWGEKWMGS